MRFQHGQYDRTIINLYSSGQPGTPDFIPPEALAKKLVHWMVLNVITQRWPEPSDQLQFSTNTDKWEVVSEVTRRQKYLNMFIGGAADLVPLVTSCLNDKPEKHPSVMEVSMEISCFSTHNF